MLDIMSMSLLTLHTRYIPQLLPKLRIDVEALREAREKEEKEKKASEDKPEAWAKKKKEREDKLAVESGARWMALIALKRCALEAVGKHVASADTSESLWHYAKEREQKQAAVAASTSAAMGRCKFSKVSSI